MFRVIIGYGQEFGVGRKVLRTELNATTVVAVGRVTENNVAGALLGRELDSVEAVKLLPATFILNVRHFHILYGEHATIQQALHPNNIGKPGIGATIADSFVTDATVVGIKN